MQRTSIGIVRGGRVAWRLALTMLILVSASPALAQQRPAPPGAAPPGQAPLQTEPGDFWADVRGWNESARRRFAPDPSAARPPDEPPAQRRPPPRRPRPAPARPPG